MRLNEASGNQSINVLMLMILMKFNVTSGIPLLQR